MTAREIFVPGVQFMFHVKHSFAPIVALAAGGRELMLFGCKRLFLHFLFIVLIAVLLIV